MTLLIREDDVRQLLPMPEAIRLVRESLTSFSSDNVPRRRVPLEHGRLNVMAASVPSSRAAGLKAYSVSRRGAGFLAALWDFDDGILLALIEADTLGRIRTGAASGVATDLLAPAGAAHLCIIGAGRQAWTQVEAVAAIRPISRVTVYSRSEEKRRALRARIQESLDVEAVAAGSAREAIEGADIVTTITSAAGPVVDGEWLSEACHVNAAGSNDASRRELASNVLTRASLIAVDSRDQAEQEAGDLCIPISEGVIGWDDVTELGALLADPPQATGITVFKSLGIAVEDVAVGRFVYDQAVSQNMGEHTTFGDVTS